MMPLQECKCYKCGKVFVPAPFHVYKDDHKIFCKWSCYYSYLKEKEQKNGARKK